MRYGTLIIASTAALALAGCGKKTETTSIDNTTIVSSDPANVGVPAALPAASAGQTFANAAASSDAFEIATSATCPGHLDIRGGQGVRRQDDRGAHRLDRKAQDGCGDRDPGPYARSDPHRRAAGHA